MSTDEFESLLEGFLDGTATADQLAVLRKALHDSASRRELFRARVRMQRAQVAVLRRGRARSFGFAFAWLHVFGQRLGRSCAHLCLLALVFVELQVTLPAEYSDLLPYLDAPTSSDSRTLGLVEGPLRLVTESAPEAEHAHVGEAHELLMPALVMPDMAMPAPDASSVEV